MRKVPIWLGIPTILCTYLNVYVIKDSIALKVGGIILILIVVIIYARDVWKWLKHDQSSQP